MKEIEGFAKKHRFEVLFVLSFIFAFFFSFVFFGPGWAILLATVGAILGVLLPAKMGQLSQKMFQFIMKQEQVTQLVLGIVILIISIFIPPLIFLMLGAHGGKSLYQIGMDSSSQK